MIRRDLIKATFGLALAGRTGRQDEPATARPQEGDLLVRANDESRTPLRPDDIPLGAMQTMAWAMEPARQIVRSGHRFNQILLVRLDPAKLRDATRAQAADGVVAYTVICTHGGCDVDDWLKDEQLLSCSCHASAFDPKDNGKVVDGPAPRALPALPLTVANGRLVVAKPFNARIGFEG